MKNYTVNTGQATYVRRPLGANLLDVSRPRVDYAANGGEFITGFGAGPSTTAAAATYSFPDPKKYNGIIYPRSELNFRRITDGTAHTYLIGEKYLDPNHYEAGDSLGDNQGPYVSDDRDAVRWTAQAVSTADPGFPPLRDTPHADLTYSFGSVHPGGFFMAMCDGSVQRFSFDIDNKIHVYQSDRSDGQVVTNQ